MRVKLRTVWLPEGAEPASWDDSEVFSFPVGTVITRPSTIRVAAAGLNAWRSSMILMPISTGARADLSGRAGDRDAEILVHREEGWAAIPYAWNDDQGSTRLARAGAFVDLTLIAAAGRTEALSYQIPDVNQCAQCHVTNAGDAQIRPIGPRARHLNGTYPYTHGGEQNQLAYWREAGLLAGGPEPDAASAQCGYGAAKRPWAGWRLMRRRAPISISIARTVTHAPAHAPHIRTVSGARRSGRSQFRPVQATHRGGAGYRQQALFHRAG